MYLLFIVSDLSDARELVTSHMTEAPNMNISILMVHGDGLTMSETLLPGRGIMKLFGEVQSERWKNFVQVRELKAW
jgi:hypothetical protein